MAQRQRVRASRARRRMEHEAGQAKVATLMQRFNGRLTTPEMILEAENQVLIHKARVAGRRKALILRMAARRLARARATGWARGQILETGVVITATARADAA